jgi:hypothetical protein
MNSVFIIKVFLGANAAPKRSLTRDVLSGE